MDQLAIHIPSIHRAIPFNKHTPPSEEPLITLGGGGVNNGQKLMCPRGVQLKSQIVSRGGLG